MNREKTLGLQGMLAVLLLVFGPAGCLITPPIRTTTAIKTVSGQKQTLPDIAPVPGKTTRAQIEEQYQAFAVESGVPNVFLGHFSQSNWAMAAGVLYAGGYAGRIWGTRNIIASFDANGILKTFEFASDRDMVARFEQIQKEGGLPPLDISRPIELNGENGSVPTEPVATEVSTGHFRYSLSSTGMTVQDLPRMSEILMPSLAGQPQPVFIPLDQITSIQGGDGLEIRLARKTSLGRNLHLQLSPGQVLTFVRWFEQEKNGSH